MKKIVLAIAAVATLVGCNKDNNEIAATGDVAVEFTNGVITRASGTEWGATDEIGIYMFNTGATTVIENKGNIQYINSKAYDVDTPDYTSATFKVVEADDIIYYPQGNVAVDFLAYYPYSDSKVAVGDYIYEVDVTSDYQVDQTAIDLMVSKNLTGKSLSKTAALELEFTHALSQLNFVVNSGTGTPDLTGLEITVGGLYNSADYTLTTGGISFEDKATSVLTVSDKSAIIIPQTADLTFTFKTDDNQTGFTTTKDAMTFNAGESTTLTFNINRSGVSFEGESTIDGWEQVNGGTTEVN